MEDSGKPHHAKLARINRLSSSSSRAAALPSQDNEQAMAAKRAANVMARYNEVNVLFSNQFPGIDISGASSSSQASTILSSSNHPDFGDGGDSFDSDLELAFELNASMGLVRHPPTRLQPETLPPVPTYPWLANSNVPECAPTTPIHTIHNEYAGSRAEGKDDSWTQVIQLGQSPLAQSFPFTSPTAGELMFTASPSDAMSPTQSPLTSSRTGDVVNDLRSLGDSLQRNAKMQLQNLSEGGIILPCV